MIITQHLLNHVILSVLLVMELIIINVIVAFMDMYYKIIAHVSSSVHKVVLIA